MKNISNALVDLHFNAYTYTLHDNNGDMEGKLAIYNRDTQDSVKSGAYVLPKQISVSTNG